jgi:hypothetical protein
MIGDAIPLSGLAGDPARNDADAREEIFIKQIER